MNMLFKYLDKPINLDDNKAKLLVIENQILFRNTMINLYKNNEDEMFLFSKNFEPVDYGKNVRFIADVLNCNYSDKKLINKIYGDMESIINTQFMPEINELRLLSSSLCGRLSEKFDYDFDFCDNIETSAFLKLFSFTPKNDMNESVEKILRYCKLLNTYLGIKCFIFFNIFIYFSMEEIEKLLDSVTAFGYNFIDIENRLPQQLTQKEEVFIIDESLCQIS